jgi:hypothetical protein
MDCVAIRTLRDTCKQMRIPVHHHFWGGLRRSCLLAGICDTFGLGLSMNSNPWKDPTEDIVLPGGLTFADGVVRPLSDCTSAIWRLLN